MTMLKNPRTCTGLLAVTVFVLGAAMTSGSQRRSSQEGAPNYDVAKEVTLQGTIEAVESVPGPGRLAGIHLILKTAHETLSVDLGPEWFLTDQKYKLTAGDAVAVVGARMKTESGESVVARLITKGTETMTFRNEKGFPRWSGRSRD